MFKIPSATIRLAVSLTLINLPHSAIAEDGIQEHFSEFEIQPDYMIRQMEADYAIIDGDVSDAVFDTSLRWNSGAVRVCFFGGSLALRKKIATIASEWNTVGADISLDFGNLDNPRICSREYSEIRVGYSQKGYWSSVGQNSVMQKSQLEQSLNLAKFDLEPPKNEDVFRMVVLHEFGHALGFGHEHTSAVSTCEEEFNFDVVYAKLSGDPHYWDRATIDKNMRRKGFVRGYQYTQPDPKSIMMYSFPAEYYKNGKASKCYVPLPTKISEIDKAALKHFYGSAGLQAFEIALGELAKASDAASSRAESDAVKSRVEILSAPLAEKARVIGIPDPRFLDVDLFQCPDPERVVALDELIASLEAIGGLGKVRDRNIAYPDASDFASGLSIIVDRDHPETIDAERLAESLNYNFPDKVSIVDNTGAPSRWYVSLVQCR